MATFEVLSLPCQCPAMTMTSVVGKQEDHLDKVPRPRRDSEGAQVTKHWLIDSCDDTSSRYKVPRDAQFRTAEEHLMPTTKIGDRGLYAGRREAHRQ